MDIVYIVVSIIVFFFTFYLFYKASQRHGHIDALMIASDMAKELDSYLHEEGSKDLSEFDKGTANGKFEALLELSRRI